MPGRHRKPSSSTGLQLSRVSVLAVLATAPLVAVGTASASPSFGSSHTPERRSHDNSSDHGKSSDRDNDGADARDDDSDDNYSSDNYSSDNDDGDNYTSKARHRAKNAYSSYRRAHSSTTRAATSSRSSRSSSPSPSMRSTDTQWDRLAECESSQNWSANTGNGYKGGLQFSDTTWRAYGGNSYAPSADRATREEQIAVARQVQREQGSRAWPGCGSRLGGA
jgi:hypothetical protein